MPDVTVSQFADVLKVPVDRLLGELLPRAHAPTGEREREIGAHAFEQQQIVRRHGLVEALLARDRLRQQHIARGSSAP